MIRAASLLSIKSTRTTINTHFISFKPRQWRSISGASNATPTDIIIDIKLDEPIIESKEEIKALLDNSKVARLHSLLTPQAQLDESLKSAYLSVSSAVLKRKKIPQPKIVLTHNTPTDLITPVELDELYDALKLPVTTQIQEAQSVHPKLSHAYLKNMHFKLLPTVDLKPRIPKETNAILRDVTDLIHVNALANRPQQAQEAFDHLLLTNIQPTIHTLNALLSSFKDTKQVTQLFKQLPSYNLKPNITTYELLIQSLEKDANYIQCTNVVQNMILNKFIPSVLIWESLLSSSIKAKKYKRADEIFAHLRKEIMRPSIKMYNQMIKSNGQNGNPDKALDLFREMESGVDEHTFVELFGALGTRNHEAFEIYDAFKKEFSVKSDLVLGALIKCCEETGDIVKARDLYSECTLKNDDMKNDLLRVYARFIRKHYIFQDNLDIDQAMETGTELSIESPAVNLSLQILVGEINGLWNSVTNPSTQILDSYLKTLTSSNATFPQALELYNTGYAEKTGDTFKYILRHVAKVPSLMNQHGEQIWADIIQWDKQLEDSLNTKSERFENLFPGNFEGDLSLDAGLSLVQKQDGMSLIEKEDMRLQQGRGKESLKELFVRMVNGYQRIGETEKAVTLLESSIVFRHVDYLPKIRFTEIWRLLVAGVTKAEDAGEYDLIERLIKACPAPDQNPLEQVKQILKTKNLSRDWWGWDAMGVGRLKREAMMNEHNQSNLRRKRVFKKREGVNMAKSFK